MPQERSLKAVIKDYLGKNLEQFRLYLDKAMDEYDPEAIHQYRVSVKRIRALIRALNRAYDYPLLPQKNIEPLRLMFKAGGSIRDDQVQIALVEDVEKNYGKSFPLIKSYYYTKIENQRDSFFLKSIDFDHEYIPIILKQFEDAIQPLDEITLESKLYERLYNSMMKLKRKRYDLDKPEALHCFRTRFKENGYIAEMLYQAKYSHKITKATYNRMKNFGQELGNWHDHFQLWSKTSIIFQESKNNDLLRECLDLRILITPVHDKLFQEILHLVKRDDTIFSV